MKQKAVIIILFSSLVFPICDIRAEESDVEKAGKILRIGLPASALTLSLLLEDEKEGALQAVTTFGTTFLTTLLLKQVIDKERPDGERYAFLSIRSHIYYFL